MTPWCAFIVRSGLVLILAGVLSGCGPTSPSVAEPPPPPVTISETVVREVVDYDDYEARIGAAQKVEIRARVRGHLMRVAFEAGQMVRQGDLLYEIDPRTYKASLDAAKAHEEAADAALGLAKAEYNRTRLLVSRGAASREELDVWTSKQAVAKADKSKARAAVEEAELNVDFTRVTAPLDGRMSRTQVDVGNLVNASGGETLLTTLVTIDPVYVYFNVDERSLIRYMRDAGKYYTVQAVAVLGLTLPSSPTGFLSQVTTASAIATSPRPWVRELNIPVSVGLERGRGFPFKGVIDFADNRVNPSTGTVQARGILSNPDRLFTDGMSAQVRIPVSDPYQAILITERAVGTDQGRKFVYVVNADSVVERRDITQGRLNDGLLIVREGLKPGEWVVVNGLQRVRDGAKVKPQRVVMPGAEQPRP
jgi:RND family efflux transporter MFP subunit